jgi:hypothetical protein
MKQSSALNNALSVRDGVGQRGLDAVRMFIASTQPLHAVVFGMEPGFDRTTI